MSQSSKEKFLRSTTAQLNKNLEREEVYHKYRIETYKRFWHQLIWNPITYLIILLIALACAALGCYCEWNMKEMIGLSFGYILTSLFTGVVEYFIIKSLDKNKIHNSLQGQ